jgi:hypothetical protein
MKGYKVFNPDWTCRGFQYEVGKTYKMGGKPVLCHRGFHFCENVADCFGYYFFDPRNKVAEVEALGEVVTDEYGGKSCTNEIRIAREVSWAEMLTLANSGKRNTGYNNSGDCNSGNRNSGCCNSGDLNSGNRNYGHGNSGDYNSGNCNSGNYNSGYKNSGNFNSGKWNSGNRNLGDHNSGDWNKTDYCSGCFCTEEQKMLFFDKESDWTHSKWIWSAARDLLGTMPRYVTNMYIWFSDMTDEEKRQYPEAQTTGGYIKSITATDADRQKWWDELSAIDKKKILDLPNFDAKKFKEITGVTV